MKQKTLKQFDFILFQEANISIAKTPPGKKKALEILEKSALFFSKHGFELKNLTQLTREIGINRSTLLNHYLSLDDLKISCVKYSRLCYQQYVSDGLSDVVDPQIRIDTYFNRVFDWPMQNPVLARLWIYFLYKTTSDKSFKKLNTDAVKVGRERLNALVSSVNSKLENDKLDELSLNIHTIITGHLWTEQTTDGTFALAEREKVILFCRNLIFSNYNY